MPQLDNISIIGGTGALGSGLASACARAGLKVRLGSRDPERAQATAKEIADETRGDVTGLGNVECAEAGDLVAVTVPFGSQSETLKTIAESVRGKIVLDTTVPLVPPKVARVQLPKEGSAALCALAALGPDTRLVTGFHSVAAQKLRKGEAAQGDVLLFSDDVAAREVIADLCAMIGLRGVHGGPLANSVAGEAMTSVLIGINKRYNVADGAGIVVTGLAGESPAATAV